MVALVVLGGLVAVSTGAPVPRALRSPARALGLPVDSADLADARTAMANLRTALAQPDDARVVAAADALVAHFRRLGPDDRAAVEADALALLARADERLRPMEIGDAAERGTRAERWRSADRRTDGAGAADDGGHVAGRPTTSAPTERRDDGRARPSRRRRLRRRRI